MKKKDHNKEFVDKKKKASMMSHILWSIAAGLAIALAIHILFFAGTFDVRLVIIKTPSVIPEVIIRPVIDRWLDDGVWGMTRRRNSLLFSESSLKDVLKKQFIRIEDVSISKPDIHTLVVEITDRKALGVWCVDTQNNCFYFESQGIAFLETQPSSGSLFAIVEDRRNRTLDLGGTVSPPAKLDTILLVRRLLQFGGVRIQKFIIESDYSNSFDVLTAEGWIIKLSATSNLQKQIANMFEVFKTKITAEERTRLEYIDLRIDNRVDYKSRPAPSPTVPPAK